MIVFELKVVLLGRNGSIWANWFYLGKRGAIWAVKFVQNGSILANWFYFGKMVLFGQIGSIWPKGGCILGEMVLWTNWF